jgi:acetate kinase
MAKEVLYIPFNQEKDNSKILVVNCGSSSIKVSLFGIKKEICSRLMDVHLTGIYSDQLKMEMTTSEGKKRFTEDGRFKVSEALKWIFDISFEKFGLLFSSFQGIGHRFVHGGSRYVASTLINSSVIADLERLSDLAPLHNEACLLGIKECSILWPAIPQVAVFDTAFHHSLPPVAANYAIRDEHQIRRYGFHGISNAFLWSTYVQNVKEKGKIITLHLGNGCSITAIKDGVSMDTSMGFSPSEGLVMATRAGDIDATVVEFLCNHAKKTPGEVMEQLNFESGLLGVSGISSDMEVLLPLYAENEKVRLAIDLFCYRIVKYLGAYMTVLEGADAIIFSGGIGENSATIRNRIISKMGWYGIKIDEDENEQAVGLPFGAVHKISELTSRVACHVIASDENAFIAKEVQKLTT